MSKTIHGKEMPEPATLVIVHDDMCWAAMFHYCIEGQDVSKVAAEHGFDIRFLEMEHALPDDHPAIVAWRDNGLNGLGLWDPEIPAGWCLGGKWDTEDGPVAVFLRPIADRPINDCRLCHGGTAEIAMCRREDCPLKIRVNAPIDNQQRQNLPLAYSDQPAAAAKESTNER